MSLFIILIFLVVLCNTKKNRDTHFYLFEYTDVKNSDPNIKVNMLNYLNENNEN